jgi:CubicO group peptidase (beta-lactamase class C family)
MKTSKTITRSAIIAVVVFLFWIPIKVVAQAIPDSTAHKIDNLFKNYQSAATPGAVIAIVRNDSLLYIKAYGSSNLEYGIANEPNTVYYICSLAKQFTAYAVLLLAKENKLQLDDDIRVYLPWMPDFGKKITIRNLLHHTSGIRDDLSLLNISGIGRNGIINQELALNILKRQRTLNFPPGEQMSYSNSNYILLAEIVRVAAGKSFRLFTDSAIFQPLHMTHSHFYDNPAQIIPNRAVSYAASGPDHYENSEQNVYTQGDGGLFMPMSDMVLWVQNFFDNKIGSSKDIELLNEKARLNDGKEVSNTTMTIKGWQAYIYNGGLNGYKTFNAVFPDLKTGFIVFANNGDDKTYNLMYPLADLFIQEKKPVANATASSSSSQPVRSFADTTYIKKYQGEYLADNNLHLPFYTDSGKLYLKPNQLLLQKTRDTFIYSNNHQIRFVFSAQAKPDQVRLAVITPDQTIQMKRYNLNRKYTDTELSSYTGTYYCEELDCRYQISFKDHRLYLAGNKYAESPIDLWDADNLKNDAVFGHFNIIRNTANAVTGFEINNGNLMHLYFKKLTTTPGG